MSSGEIDFVLIWVDGADPVWRSKRDAYRKENTQGDAQDIRYRDWNLLRYWFRGVERFAPWVRYVYFVTDGQRPQWLKKDHPKLKLVNHHDFIPKQYLPTFSSHPIELNLHRIEGLSEQFVYFNDDMFLTRPIDSSIFFRNHLPCDSAVLSPVIITEGMNDVGRVMANNMAVINSHFNKQQVIHNAFFKWFSPCYGKQLLRSLCLSPWKHFPGFFNDHLPQPFLRSTFQNVWLHEQKLLNEVCTHKFRDYSQDVNQWLMRYWQLCENHFSPISPSRGRDLDITNAETLTFIRKQMYSMVCLNDKAAIADFETVSLDISAAFQHILPDKCSFELF